MVFAYVRKNALQSNPESVRALRCVESERLGSIGLRGDHICPHPERPFRYPLERRLVFRLYSPMSDELKELQDPIEMRPVEALDMVAGIIREAQREAPHLPETRLSLAPRRIDSDLKRIMKPQIDELLEETKDALVAMRAAKKRSPAAAPCRGFLSRQNEAVTD
jgi:hypothetical protein